VRHAPECPENKGDLLSLNELTGLLDCLWRTITIIETDQVDLATIHSAYVVDHLEIGRFGLPDYAVSRSWPTVGHRLADLDLRITDSWSVRSTGESQARCEDQADRRETSRDKPSRCHDFVRQTW